MGFPGNSVIKNLPAVQEMQVQSLGQEDPLEKEMATHSGILTWEIPWSIAHQAPLSMGFPRQEYWHGQPFSSPGDLPDPGIEPASPVMQADSLPLRHQGSPQG